MPVTIHANLRRASEKDFTEVAYKVMGNLFEIHNDFGRFFDEEIYQRELARRMPGIVLEAPIELRFEPFHKLLYLDVIADECAVFELKTVEALNERHRAQLLQYLLLCDLRHGKLVNLRTEGVQHEFLNAVLNTMDRVQFEVHRVNWLDIGDLDFAAWFLEMLRDLGIGLEVSLYEEALTQFLGGPGKVEQSVSVLEGSHIVGTQPFRLVTPEAAFKVTTLNGELESFASHARRLLAHTSLTAIQWINVGRQTVTLQTLRRN